MQFHESCTTFSFGVDRDSVALSVIMTDADPFVLSERKSIPNERTYLHLIHKSREIIRGTSPKGLAQGDYKKLKK